MNAIILGMKNTSSTQSQPKGTVEFIEDAAAAVLSLTQKITRIEEIISLITKTLVNGGKVLAAGNGGSAAEAMHLAEELSGRYKNDRQALPGISLCSDGTVLTCIANDYGFEKVFSRQVEALGAAGDVLVLFSTSGNSDNLTAAAKQAKEQGLSVIALLGGNGGSLLASGNVTLEICVTGTAGAHVQEAHQVLIHAILEQVDATFTNISKTG